MRVIILGRGQLGSALYASLRSRSGASVFLWARPEYDLTNPAISEQVAALRPDVVINTAAWTDVDGAEAHPDAAYATNALGPKYLADGCAACNALLVQVSTNEVFAGVPGRFYREYDQPAPGGVYACSKAAGEQAVLISWPRSMIVRVAWLYGPGGKNFPTKILAAAEKHGSLRVVADEFGNPTYAPDAAAAILRLIETNRTGVYHVVNEGHASRYEFACALLAAGGRSHVPIVPIAAKEWPRPVPPPAHAVLVNRAAAALGVVLRPWQSAVEQFMSEVQ